MRGLYPIVDLDSLASRSIIPRDFVGELLVVRPPLMQLRAKHSNPRETLELLRVLRPLTRAAGVALFANDRPDLALLADCDGVHVGQEDLSVEEVRRIAPQLKVGVSTHDLDQLEEAIAAEPDYVAFGPVFPTRSKERPEPVVGLEGLERAAARAREAGVPLVAIGGIDEESAPQVGRLGALGAVIGALVSDNLSEVRGRASRLHELLGGGE